MVNPEPAQDLERKSLWAKFKDTLLGSDDLEEDEAVGNDSVSIGTVATASHSRKPAALRLQSMRTHTVAVRTNAQVFEDAKLAADGLKAGEQQIVNLEKASPHMAERIIDFLNGVCYALDGAVEKVGDKVYLFVPANVAVEIDNGPHNPKYGSDLKY